LNEALLLIDMQREFYCQDKEAFDQRIIPNLREALRYSRNQRRTIVHVVTRYSADKSDWPEVRKPNDSIWCMENCESSRMIDGFEPMAGEHLIVKKRFSGFYQTNLDEILQKNDVKHLFLAGYSSDVCIRMTAMDAYNIGYGITLLKDCMYSDREPFEDSLEYLRWLIGCDID